MPHVHGVCWLNFSEKEEKDYLLPDKTFNLESPTLHELIDQWCQCKLDTENETLSQIVADVQIHTHRNSCQKRGDGCRFDFPKLPSPYTLVATPPPPDLPDEVREAKIKRAEEIKEKAKEILEQPIPDDWDIFDFLDELGCSLQEYVEDCLKVSKRGAVVVLARDINEVWVNNYNKNYLYAWRANMDLQICLDPYAVVSYISDYLSKADAEITKSLRRALNETKGLPNDERIKHLKTTYFTHREICSSEAVYRLSRGLNLRQSNLKTVYVDSGFPQNRSAILKKIGANNDLNENHLDDSDESTNEEQICTGSVRQNLIEIMGRQGKYMKGTSIHDKYSLRPQNDDIKQVCLAQFATTYEQPRSMPKNIEWNDNVSAELTSIKIFGTDKFLPKFIQLANGKVMKARTIPAVIKLYNSKKKSNFEAAYGELVLFLPWRNEADLCAHKEPACLRKFDENFDLLQMNRKAMLPFSSTLEQIRESIQLYEEERATSHDDILDSAFQQDQDEDQQFLDAPDLSELPGEADERIARSDEGTVRQIKMVDDQQMIADVRSLSFDQRIAFQMILSYCKYKSFSKSIFSIDILPPRLIAHGKSYMRNMYL